MTRAYDSLLLERAADNLGRMLDFASYSLNRDASSMMGLFIASGGASLFERGDIRVIAGMSGIELAYEVLDRSGIGYERTVPRHTRSLSGEYWCGRTLVLIQWETSIPFSQILSSFSVPGFISEYGKQRTAFLDSLPLDISTEERAGKLRGFGESFSSEAARSFISSLTCGRGIDGSSDNTLTCSPLPDTPLKKMRIKNGLSQSGLAKASGVPVRTIQQYEQRQKDLRKARAEYLIMLSNALGCSPASLLE